MARLRRWFGRAWGWPSLSGTEHADTPVGRFCAHCGNPLLPNDQGVEIDGSGPIHRHCFYGFVFGRKAA